jgi:DNA repair exonuclease SbcCD nuclease subunit
MGKIIFTSDLHADRGLKVQICITYLEYLEEYCFENGINDIVFGGDIINKSSKINNDVFVPLFLKLMEMKNKGLNLIFILGNHDIFNKDNDSILRTFSSFGHVVIKSETMNIAGYDYDLLSYTNNKEEIPNSAPTILTHLPISTFFYDNGFGDKDDDGFTPDDFASYNLVVTGHYHKTQKKGKIVYPGSPFQQNFGEQGHDKFFAIVEGDSYELIPYNNAPTYLTIKIEDFKKYDYKNKFVLVEISRKVENFIKLKHILYTQGAIEVKPSFIKEELIEDEGEHEVDINENISISMKKFLSSIKDDKVDNKKLLCYFDNILSEVK